MPYIETRNLQTWREYVELHENSDLSPYIFRGQSNAINADGNFTRWNLESSFNRFYSHKSSLQFSNVINQHLQNELFNFYYSRYSYSSITELTSLDALQKCYYLQHYGLPTALIDFTFDPLVAMYFAMSGIQGSSGQTFDGDGNCIRFSNKPDRDYVSIFKLNCNILKKYFSIQEIQADNFDTYFSSYKTFYHTSRQVNVKIGLMLKTEVDLCGNKNYNLSKQKGCFILFDNEEGINIGKQKPSKVDFVTFLHCHEEHFNLELPEPALTIYNIPYNAFMWKKNRTFENGQLDSNQISAFEFLRRKGLTGKELFNDIQGLKYDFNFISSIDR